MSGLVETLLLPFEFDFIVYAMVISALVAVPMALLSCFLVLRGWSLMGDAVSHGVLPGVVLAYMAGLPLALGAFCAGMVCALGTGYLKANSRVKEDTVMGVVFSGMFGLGIVLYTAVKPDVHLDHILFGDVLGVSLGDIAESAVITVLVSLIIAVKWRDLLLQAFDPAQARAIGLPVGWLHYGFLALLSLTIVGALKAVGIILAVALLIAPGAIAFLITRRFGPMLLTAVAVAMICAFLGVYAAFFLDSAPAPTIVLVLTAAFLAAFVRARLQAWRMMRSSPGLS